MLYFNIFLYYIKLFNFLNLTNMIKKKEFNGQFKSKIKDNIIIKDILQPKKIVKKEIPNKLKVNLSSSLKYITKKKSPKKFKNIAITLFPQIISKNLQKYNSNSEIKNIMMVNNLIKCKSCHFLAIFKDYLITDYIEEFLRRIYFLNESTERIPKLYNYYKNYLLFFCKPTFTETFSNEIIKNYGDLNAECFYKNNLERKRSHHEDKRILDQKIIGDMNKNNKNNEELVKTVFTKSIKYSIDNIDAEDSISTNGQKGKNDNIFINEFSKQETLTKVWGSDNCNLFSEENSLLLMINEIKDNQKITEKKIKMNKILSCGNYNNLINNNKIVPIESSYKTLNTEKSYKNFNIKSNSNTIKENKNNIIKAGTYTNNNKCHFDSIQNMVYSPKSKKNAVFSIKKDKNDKDNKYLSPKNKTISNSKTNNITKTSNKSHNSIVVNINININTNQNNNNIDNNIKSPINKIAKKRFPLSPLAPINLNILNEKEFLKKELPLSSARNNERDETKEKSENSNYIKIVKKKQDYSNLLLSNKRNKKIIEINKMKNICSLEGNELINNQNYSCNKDMFLYKKNSKEINGQNNNFNSTENKNVYFSPKKLGFKPRHTNSMKELENTSELNNKKFVYHKKPNNTINSPLNKKSGLGKKVFSYKKLENFKNIYE